MSVARSRRVRMLCPAVALVAFVATAVPVAAQPEEHWVATWATAEVGRRVPTGGAAPARRRPIQFTNQTLRQVVHVSIGGSRVRVVVSNRFGIAPVTIGAAHLAVRDQGAAIVRASRRPLLFAGRATTTIPPGAVMLTDPVDLEIPPLSDLAVDLYVPGTTDGPSPLTMHTRALQTNYVSETGNHVGSTEFPTVATVENWFLLSRVEVVAAAAVGAVVTFGDSITDGFGSTPDTNRRWPDILAGHLATRAAPMAVLNVGIGGNRLLGDGGGISALARFDRHVLSQPGVRYVVVMEGINDIGVGRDNPTPTAEDLIAAHKQLIARAHARGLTIYGATLTPFEGAAYYTDVGEAKRQAVNAWIRTSGDYDAVFDFDALTRDPNDPARFHPDYHPGDFLHPNDAGYRVMADSIDLALFK